MRKLPRDSTEPLRRPVSLDALSTFAADALRCKRSDANPFTDRTPLRELKQHTIIFVPHARAKFRKWRFSTLQAGIFFGSLTVLTLGGLLAIVSLSFSNVDEEQLQQLRTQLQQLAPEAVAINLLFSFVDDRFERAIEAVVPAGMFVSRSSAILPEYREYERGITTGSLSGIQFAKPGDTVTAAFEGFGTVKVTLEA